MNKIKKIEDRTLRFIEEYNKLKTMGKAPTHDELAEIIGLKYKSSVSGILNQQQNIQPEQWEKFKDHFKIKDVQNGSDKSVPRGTTEQPIIMKDHSQDRIQDLKEHNDTLKQVLFQNLNTLTANLTGLQRLIEGNQQLLTALIAGQAAKADVIMESLDRVEKRPLGSNASAADKKELEFRKNLKKLGNQNANHKIGTTRDA